MAEVFRILPIEELCEENEKSKEENERRHLLRRRKKAPKITKKKKSKAKKHKIKIDRIEVCKVDQNILPDDAEFKGYQDVVVQEIIIKTDNVKYNLQSLLPRLFHGSSQRPSYRTRYTAR